MVAYLGQNGQTIFLLLLCAYFHINVYLAEAQRWHLANGPYQAYISKFAINPQQTNVVYAAVWGGNYLYKSTDGGNTWFDIGPEMRFSIDPTVAVDPINPSIIYLGSEKDGILNKSTDGGITWGKKYLQKDSLRSSISSIAIDPKSPNIVYVGLRSTWNDKNIWKSSDWGETWIKKTEGIQRRNDDSALARGVNAIVINSLNTSVIFANVSRAGLYRSDNAAESWRYTGFDSLTIHDIAILPWDTASVLLATDDGLFKSTDGGTTWSNQLPEYRVSCIDMDTNGEIIYAGTLDNWAFKSFNDGQTWNAMLTSDIPASESRAMTVNDILVDPQYENMVYLGTNVGPYKSTDGGKSWQQCFDGLTYFRAIDIKISPSHPYNIYAAGSQGVYRSSDGGVSWKYIGGLYDIDRISVHPDDPDIIYYTQPGAIDVGLFMRTLDGGNEWRMMRRVHSVYGFITTDLSEQHILYTSSLSLYAADSTLSRGMLRSFDYGETWDVVYTPSLTYSLAIKPDDPNQLHIGGTDVYKSMDRGETWDSLNVPSANTFKDVYLDQVNSQTLYAVARGDGIFKSTDGGGNWFAQDNGLDTLNFPSHYVSLHIHPSNPDVLFLRADTSIFHSVDGGDNWNLMEHFPFTETIYSLAIDTSQGNRLLAGGNFPGIYALDLTATSFVEDRYQQLPSSSELYQNYPNPFNPTTKIKYSLPENDFVTLKVFNMLGQVVAVLVNQHKNAGEYVVDFDASNLASGIYVYRIQAGNFSQTKKMILLR